MRNSAGSGVLKFFLMGLLTLAVAGLVLMDIGGFFTGNVPSGTVAKGKGITIGSTEFARTVDRALSRQNMNPQMAYQTGLVDNILTAEIQNRIFTREAFRLGFIVDDASVTRQISEMAAPLAAGGGNRKDALQQLLRAQGISEAEFIGGVRQEMGNGLLRAALQPPPTLASPPLAQALYRYDSETRKASVIVFRESGITDVTAPDDAQLEAYYEANKGSYLIPETRKITIATLKGDMVKKNIVIPEERIRAEYERNIGSYTKPERREIEQLVVNTKEEAEAAVAAYEKGKPLRNALMQEYQSSGLMPEIAAPAFTAEIDEPVGPVRTELGWHVLVVKKIIPQEVTPFESVRERLRSDLENIALGDEMYKAANTIEDHLAAGDSLKEAIDEYGMTTRSIGPFKSDGTNEKGEDLFSSFGADRGEIISAAFDYEEGETAQIIETADGQFQLVHIDSVTPDSYRPFESVKNELRRNWIGEQRRLAVKAQAAKAAEALASGADLETVAADQGQKIQQLNLSRKESAPAPLTPLAAARIFASGQGESFSAEIADGIVVGLVTEAALTGEIPAPDNAELAALRELTGTSLAQDSIAQYMDKLVDMKKIKINKATLDMMFGDPSLR